VRPEVTHFEPYLPGRSMESVRRERGLKRIIKLASNENALGPSSRALQALANVRKNIFRYPDGASQSLRMALARKYHLPVDRVIVGAGSDELIELLGKTFLNSKDSIVVSEHAFIRYRMAGELMGAKIISVPMRGYTHNLEAMGDAIEPSTKLVFIANPNNPTGTYNTASELESLLSLVAKKNLQRRCPVLVVVDEAYYEFARAFQKDYPDTQALQKSYPNLVVLRTFSKVYALAGLRVGYGFADPEIIEAMDRVRPPFNINVAAQAAAEASLADEAHVRRSVQLIFQESRKMLPALARLDIPVVPSVGNFILIDVAPRRGEEMFEMLLNRGIIVRSMDEYGFPHYIRLTYGLPSENQAFLKVLREVVVA